MGYQDIEIEADLNEALLELLASDEYNQPMDVGTLLEEGMCFCGEVADATPDECRACIERTELEMLESYDPADDYESEDGDGYGDYDYDDGRFDFMEGFHDNW